MTPPKKEGFPTWSLKRWESICHNAIDNTLQPIRFHLTGFIPFSFICQNLSNGTVTFEVAWIMNITTLHTHTYSYSYSYHWQELLKEVDSKTSIIVYGFNILTVVLEWWKGRGSSNLSKGKINFRYQFSVYGRIQNLYLNKSREYIIQITLDFFCMLLKDKGLFFCWKYLKINLDFGEFVVRTQFTVCCEKGTFFVQNFFYAIWNSVQKLMVKDHNNPTKQSSSPVGPPLPHVIIQR